MYVPETEPRWAQCSFCKNRDLYDNLQPVGMTDREGCEEPRACKKCSREMSEDAVLEIRADQEFRRILRKMLDENQHLVYAHGGLFHLGTEEIGDLVVEEMEKRSYIAAFRHPHAARAFELTERGRSVAEEDVARAARGRWPTYR